MTNSVTFSTTVGGDGSVITDDSNASTGLGNGGHRVRFVPALSQTVAVAANTVTTATASATSATASATSATASAASATAAAASATLAAAEAASILSNPATSATSTTSLTLATGAQVLTTTPTGKSFYPGMSLKIFNSVGNYMAGTCTAYNSGTGVMTVQVEQFWGSGTYASWTVGVWVPDLSIENFLWALILN